jgi:hypothetical protein
MRLSMVDTTGNSKLIFNQEMVVPDNYSNIDYSQTIQFIVESYDGSTIVGEYMSPTEFAYRRRMLSTTNSSESEAIISDL